MVGLALQPQRGPSETPAVSPRTRAPEANPNVGNQARIRRLQAKLTIGAVDDPLEREADAAADRVMRMADPRVTQTAPPTLSRKSVACETSAKPSAAPASVQDVLLSPGRPLDAATRNYFEPRFGRDLSQARVHVDTAAQRSARDVDAPAYSVGRNIVFGAGKFSPNTDAGRYLLAHELAHVVQQDGAAMPRLLRAPKATAQFGDIKPHKEQGKARWSGAVRLSEHEHIRARINLWIQTFDSQTSTSPYDKAAYRRSSTITIPKDMADIKTRMDMQIRDRLRAAQRSGVVNASLVRELEIEADIERTVRARDQAIQARRRQGLSTADLESITTEKITRTAHYQQGELFDVGKSQRSPISAATDAEIEAAIAYAEPVAEPHANVSGPTIEPSDAAPRSAGAVEHVATTGGEGHAPNAAPLTPTGGSPSRPSTARQALSAAGKTADIAGLAAAGGEIIKQLYEGNYVGAAKTAGLTGSAVVLGDAAIPLALAYATIQGYDEDVKRDANRAGSRVERAIGRGSTVGRYAGATAAATVATGEAAYKGITTPWASQYTENVKKRSTGVGEKVEDFIGEGSTVGRVAGALATSATATGEVAFRGTFGVVGKGIGEGLAAGWLWVTGQGDEEYEVPAYYEQNAANRGKFKRARAHLNELIAAHPDSPAAAAAGQLLKQIVELEVINSDYRKRKTWSYWLSAQASVIEQEAFSLRN